MKDVCTVSSSALPANTRVAGVRGSEALSSIYTFDVYALMTHDLGQSFNMADAIGAKATLTLDRGDGRPPFQFHGIFSAVELVHEFGGRAVFRATLVPHLWQLTQTMHSRLFTDQSIPDIIKTLLEEGGVDDFAFKLIGDYPPEEHVCQYHESDFDFISRWMEREGMYYYFEQGDSGEKLIITDDKLLHGPLGAAPVRYFPQPGGDVTAGESLRTFSCRHVSLPGSVRVRDYDYARPALDVSSRAPVSQAGLGEINTYGLRVFSPAQSQRLANIRAEELRAREVVVQGAGTAWYLRPGYIFTLEEHPRAALNARYLTTQVDHLCNQTQGAPELKQALGFDADDVYRADLRAIPADAQFRSERRTAWPRIYGYENGIVDGPGNSEYAQIDEQGRYKVKFNFDESDLNNSKASTWVRMMQPHGGSIEGWHFPLRKGTEVIFTFLGGDPDRPVIAGVVPNALTPSPITSANHTRNVIQTGGRNRFELEDQAGSQRITLSTPTKNTYLRMGAPNDDHNLIEKTDGTGLIHTGESLDVYVGSWKHEIVKAKVTEDYTGPQKTTVTNDVTRVYNAALNEHVDKGQVTETYKAQKTTVANLREAEYKTQKTHVLTTVDETYDGKHTTNVTAGGRHEEIKGATTQIIHGTLSQTVDEAVTETLKGGLTTTVTGSATQTATGDWTIEAEKVDTKSRGQWKWSTLGDKVTFTIGATSDTILGIKNENVIAAKIDTVVGAHVEARLAAKIEALIGVHISYNSAPGLEFGPAQIKGIQAKIDSFAIGKLMRAGIWLSAHGFEIHG